MNRENDLVQKISLLKNVEPRNSWVLFAKTRILADSERITADIGERAWAKPGLAHQVGHVLSYLRYLERPFDFAQAKPAFVLSALAFVVLGGVGYQASQNSLPGDPLYSVRSALEQATTGNDPLASLEVAQRRLQDLKKVVEENRVKNLSSATQEFNQSVAEASRGFIALVENDPKRALQASRELVQLQKDKAHIEQVLGASLGEQEEYELENATRILVEREFADLTTRTLTADQEELFKEAVAAYKDQRYEEALEYVWAIANETIDN